MRSFWIVWLSLLLLKLAVSAALPLSTDEAYYWVWGQHLQLSYFDHPGMIAWLFGLGERLSVGWQSARWPGVLVGHLTLLTWCYLLKPAFKERDLIGLMLFMAISPLIGLGSLIITPDIPVLFFWALSMVFFNRALEDGKWSNHLALGAMLGLGFCSKYHIVLFVPCAFLFIWRESKWQLLQPKKIASTILVGLIFCGPVLIWNYQNSFASFRFQLEHGLGETEPWKIRWPLEYFFGQLFLVFPTIWWALKRRDEPEALRTLRYFGLFPLAFFMLTSLHAKVEANWPIVGYPALLALGYYLMSPRARKWTAAIWAMCAAMVFAQVIYPWMPVDEKSLKTYEFKRYSKVVEHYKASTTPAWAGSYQMASSVSYRLKKPIYKLKGVSRHDFYDEIPESIPHVDKFLVYAELEQYIPKWMVDKGYKMNSVHVMEGEFQIIEVERDAALSDH